jgi:hypothetical protein
MSMQRAQQAQLLLDDHDRRTVHTKNTRLGDGDSTQRERSDSTRVRHSNYMT